MTPARRRSRAGRVRGFTLVEVIATIVVVAIIGTLSSGVLLSAAEGYHAAATRAQLANSASAAMERIAVALRDIPQRASTTPTVPAITAVGTNSISWDGGMGIALSGSNLQLTVGGIASTLADHVSDFEIRVFDQDNLAMNVSLNGSACDPIRRVQFTLTVSRDGLSETLRSRVFLRCMLSGADS